MEVIKIVTMLGNCLFIYSAKKSFKEDISKEEKMGSWAMIIVCFLNLICIAM